MILRLPSTTLISGVGVTVGSFTGTRDDSYLKLGEDTYRMGTGFTLGGDFGSEEHYLNVINTTDDISRIVTLRIEKAEDIYIRGTEAYPLVYDYETIPYGADTEISVVTDLTPEKLAGAIVEAIDRYQGIADSSEAAEEEKEEAAARLATLTRLIARVMVKDSPDSAVFRGKLLLVLRKAVENSVLGEEEAAAAVESFDAWMELTFGEDETGTDQSQEDDGNGTGQSPDENESGTGTEQNPQAYVLSAEQLEEILTQVLSGGARAALIADHASGVFHTEDAQGYDSEGTETYLELYRSLMEQDETDRIMEALRETAEAEKPENVPMPPRPMEVVIGESTGTDGVHISNYGEITLIQERGNLHIGRIETNNPWLTPEADALSDVWVDSLEGSIIGTVRPDGKANISADHIFLHAGGSILDLLVDEVAHAYEVGTQIRTRKDGEEVVVPELTLALKEDGTPETDAEGNPVIISGAYADYTGTFTYDTNAATRVNATADRGDIEISEAAGYIGLGVLNAPNGKVRISAGPVVDEDGNAAVDEQGNVIRGDVLDVRTNSQKEAGNANITAGCGGSITGGRIGTAAEAEADQEAYESPILVHILNTDTDPDAVLVIDAVKDILVRARGSLNTQADTTEGKLYLEAGRNLTVSNTLKSSGGTGDMILVSPREGNNLTVISAGNFCADIAEDGTLVPAVIEVPGSVSITAAGTIYAVTVTAGNTAALDAEHIEQADRDRDAFILADSVSVSVRDDLGSTEVPFLVDTKSGRTGAGTLSIRARSAVVNELSGDVTLKDVRTEGDFTLNVPGSVTDGNGTQDNAAAAAQAALDEAAEHAAAAAAAVKILEDHENRTGTLTAEDRAKLNAARDGLAAAQAELARAAEAARAAKEAAAQAESTIQTGGDMNLTAGGGVGENGHGLSVDAAGVVSVTAGADVHLTSDTGLSVKKIQGNNSSIQQKKSSVLRRI